MDFVIPGNDGDKWYHNFEKRAKARKKYAIYLSWSATTDLFEACPILAAVFPTEKEAAEACNLVIFFDHEEDLKHAFFSTVGEDGPTKLNSYNGDTKVFATTCDPNGRGMHVNT